MVLRYIYRMRGRASFAKRVTREIGEAELDALAAFR
jgi:hypothetical protein